jgi:cytochrome P450
VSTPAAASWPGRPGWPLVGDLVAFGRDPLGFCERLSQEHGDRAHFRLVDHHLWLLSHPDDIEQILVRDAKVLHKDVIYELLRPMLGDGLVTAEDEPWRRHRKLLAPLFTKRHVEVWADTMVRCTRDEVAGWADGATVDVHAAMMALTQRIVLDTLFGSDLDVDTSGVARAIDDIMNQFVSEAQGPLRLVPKGVPTPSRRRTTRAIAELDATVFSLIEARRRAGLGDDLLSRLLAAKDEAGALTDREVRDEAVTAFVAGHETTALALTWTFVLLGENPRAWGPLRDEVERVLGGRPATAADFGALPYVTATLKESMRLLPPVWGFGRLALEDLELGDLRVPRGHNLLVCPWVTQRDPRWWPEPLWFRPERWLDEAFVASLPRMAWFPFGGGPRVCVGQHFAMLEAVLALATLVQHGTLTPTGPRPAMLPSITLRPIGEVPARWDRRSSR